MFIKKDSFGKVLDLGCADNKLGGIWKFPNYSFEGKVIGIDYIKSKNTDIICNLNKGRLPLKDESFDIVYAHHTLEHLKNVAEIIPEIWRILKKGGFFLVRVPYLSSSFGELTHLTQFSYNTLDCFISNKSKNSAKYDYQIENKFFLNL